MPQARIAATGRPAPPSTPGCCRPAPKRLRPGTSWPRRWTWRPTTRPCRPPARHWTAPGRAPSRGCARHRCAWPPCPGVRPSPTTPRCWAPRCCWTPTVPCQPPACWTVPEPPGRGSGCAMAWVRPWRRRPVAVMTGWGSCCCTWPRPCRRPACWRRRANPLPAARPTWSSTTATALPCPPGRMLRQGFSARQGPAPRPLGIAAPPGPRGGQVFDAAEQWVGLAQRDAAGQDLLLPVSALQQRFGPWASTEAPAPTQARPAVDLLDERALRSSLQSWCRRHLEARCRARASAARRSSGFGALAPPRPWRCVCHTR